MEKVGVKINEVAFEDFNKPAGVWCPSAVPGKGCGIYASRPFGCRNWSCFWLLNGELTPYLNRPDKAKYVIDSVPDYTTIEASGRKITGLQIWTDKDHPNAHRDKGLRLLLERYDLAGIVRRGGHDGLAIIPPKLSPNGRWQEIEAKPDDRHNQFEYLGSEALKRRRRA